MRERVLIPELILDAKALLGEGPCWHEPTGELYWVDIEGEAVHIFDPGTGVDRRIGVGQMPGFVVARRSGGMVVGTQHGFQALDPATGVLTPIHDPEVGLKENRFNDGKCDSAGRLWAGTTRIAHDRADGALYCLDAGGGCHRKLGDIWISNGLAWSGDDQTMYYIDSPTQRVVAFDFDVAGGGISGQRTVIEVPEGMGTPDGMTIDEEGMLWVALWDGWRVTRWNPADGRLLGEVEMPVARPTSCVFGGENLDELYITSASTRLPAGELAKQPLAGGLFRVRPGIRGARTHAWAG
jgi:sugar lactone lactonase YvrE